MLLTKIGKMKRHFEGKIKEILLSRFAVVFDGLSTGKTYYIKGFATYPSLYAIRYKKILLRLSSMEEETTENAREQYECLVFVLLVYDCDMTSVVALIENKISTIREFSRMLGTFLYWWPKIALYINNKFKNRKGISKKFKFSSRKKLSF